MTWQHDLKFREESRRAAETVLIGRDFRLIATTWHGKLAGMSCEVVLNDSFPFSLPIIRVRRTPPFDTIAHVDGKGTICFADSTNILIDTASAALLMEESLARSEEILKAKNSTSEVIADEFGSYWEASATLQSICTLEGELKEVVVAKRPGRRPYYLAADTEDALNRWLKNRNESTHSKFIRGVILPLSRAPIDLLRSETLRLRNIWRIAHKLIEPEQRSNLKTLLSTIKLPLVVIVTFPTSASMSFGAVGVIVRAPDKIPGFRLGKARPCVIHQTALAREVEKAHVRRFDPSHLLPRGGASVRARQRKILLVGAGAVGSWVAQLLATSGIGQLGIVDPDTLAADNVHRHVLGMESIGKHKAEAMATRLRNQFPHQEVWSFNDDCMSLFSDPTFNPAAYDLIILATGNETLEQRLCNGIATQTALAHVWLDPLDLGYHIFANSRDNTGCYSCLFGRDETVGLHNRASFLEKGQSVTKTLSGCSGSFVDYSIRHALAAASRTVELALAGELENGPLLVSKFCDDKNAIASQLRTSARRDMFRPGEELRFTKVSGATCERCIG